MTVIDLIREELDKQEEYGEILEVYQTGSTLFWVKPNDIDLVVIVSEYAQRRRKFKIESEGVTWDIVIMSAEAVNRQLDLNDTTYIDKNLKIFNYFFLLKDTIYGGYDIEWSLLADKDNYLNFVKDVYNETMAPLRNKIKHAKRFAHYYAILRMIDADKEELDGDMIRCIRYLYEGTDEEKVDIINYVDKRLRVEEE